MLIAGINLILLLGDEERGRGRKVRAVLKATVQLRKQNIPSKEFSKVRSFLGRKVGSGLRAFVRRAGRIGWNRGHSPEHAHSVLGGNQGSEHEAHWSRGNQLPFISVPGQSEDVDTFLKCQIPEMCRGIRSGVVLYGVSQGGGRLSGTWWVWVKISLPRDYDISVGLPDWRASQNHLFG